MKKLTEYIQNKYVSLKGLDESVVERLSNMEGYEITECCGSYAGDCNDCYGYDEPCDGSCETTCAGTAVPVATAPIVQDPIQKYTSIFTSAPKVMDVYNAHGEFTYKCRFDDEYQRGNTEPLIFVSYNGGYGVSGGPYQNSRKLHDDILTICSEYGLSEPVLLIRGDGDIQLFAIKHMGTNGKECSIKNSLSDAAVILAKLETRKEITWAQVLDIAIDNADDLYTFLFTCTFEKEKYDKELEERAKKNEFPNPINKHA